MQTPFLSLFGGLLASVALGAPVPPDRSPSTPRTEPLAVEVAVPTNLDVPYGVERSFFLRSRPISISCYPDDKVRAAFPSRGVWKLWPESGVEERPLSFEERTREFVGEYGDWIAKKVVRPTDERPPWAQFTPPTPDPLIAIHVHSGEQISLPPPHGEIVACDPTGRRLALVRPNKNHQSIEMDIVRAEDWIAGEPISFSSGKIPELAAQFLERDPKRSFIALRSLRVGAITAEEVLSEVEKRNAAFLKGKDPALLKEGLKVLGNEFRVRESATEEITRWIRTDTSDFYDTKLRPALLRAMESDDAEIRHRAQQLLRIPPRSDRQVPEACKSARLRSFEQKLR